MYYYYLFLFITLTNAQPFLIGTGRGILSAVGGGIKELAWDPYTFGGSAQQWRYQPDERFPNGAFFTSQTKVWDAEGFTSKPGTAIFLYIKKDTLYETKNQRWVWTSDQQISTIMNSSSCVTVSPGGTLQLAAKNVNDPYQTFIPVDPTRITATIRNYLADTTAYVSVASPFGSYDFGSARYQALSVLQGFVIRIKDKNGIDLSAPHPVCKYEVNGTTIVVGTPKYPGTSTWAMYKTEGSSTQKYICNMTFANYQIAGTAREVTVYYNATRGANETQLGIPLPISGTYQADGNVHIYFNFISHYRGMQYDGIFYYQSPTSMTIEGTWGDMDLRKDNYTIGQFEFILQKS